MTEFPHLNGRLLLVRHARTHDNLAERLCGWTDSVIDESSLDAAEHVAAYIRDTFPVDAFYCSPLSRARITAGIIGLAIRREPLIEEGLKEMHFGDAEGLTRDEFKAINPSAYEAWQATHDLTWAWPNGESRQAFQDRVKSTITRLLGRHPGQTVLAVSHGGAIGGYVAFTCDKGLEVWRNYQPENCSLSEIVFRDGHPELVRFSDTTYLPKPPVASETVETAVAETDSA